MAPREYEDYLRYQYGEDWRTPIQRFEYAPSKLARFKQVAVSYAKAMIPMSILEWMQDKKEQQQLNIFIERIEKERKRKAVNA
jgi:hypothetical protein